MALLISLFTDQNCINSFLFVPAPISIFLFYYVVNVQIPQCYQQN